MKLCVGIGLNSMFVGGLISVMLCLCVFVSRMVRL